VSRIDAGRLAGQIAGEVVMRGHHDYDVARRVWNGMIDRRPAVIVRCMSAVDVAAALDFASDAGLRVAVRGGPHNIAGNATCDDGLVVDLSPMQSVEVDIGARRARAAGGVTWGVFDEATQRQAAALRRHPADHRATVSTRSVQLLEGQLRRRTKRRAHRRPHRRDDASAVAAHIHRHRADGWRHRADPGERDRLPAPQPIMQPPHPQWLGGPCRHRREYHLGRELFARTEPLCSRPAWHGSSTSPTLPRRLRRYGLTAGWIEPKELSRDRTYSVDLC